jgi:general secretion pathway protein D
MAQAQSATPPDVPIKAADSTAISATPPVRNWFRPIREPGAAEGLDATLKRGEGGDPKRPVSGQAVPVRRVVQGDPKRPNWQAAPPLQARPNSAPRPTAGQGGNPVGPPTFAQRQAQPGGTRTIPRTPPPTLNGGGQNAALESDDGLVVVDSTDDLSATEPRAVMLYYLDRELKHVIEAIAEHLQINIDYAQEDANTLVNLITNEPIPSESLMFVLESILGARDLQILPTADGQLYRVSAIDDGREHIDVIIDRDQDPQGFETQSTRIIQLNHADAGEIIPILQNVGSGEAQIDAYGQTNMLIVTDKADGIRNMMDIIDAIDIAGYSESLEYFPLEYARAEVISTQITEILTGEGGTAAPQQGVANIVRQAPSQINRGRAPIPGQRPSPVVTLAEQTLRIVADERLNMLMVVASEPLMDQVRDLIGRLDSPTSPDSNNMHVYRLLYANAEEVQSAIAELIGAAPPVSSGEGQGGGAASTTVQAFEKDVSVTLYDKLNALFIVASPQDYRALRAFISQIDIPTLQVFVKAIIMEVTLNDRFELEVEAASLTANDYFALNNVANLANVLSGGPLAVAGPGLSTGLLDGTTDISVSDGAGGITTQTIPNVPLLLTMLETLTTLDVLAEPSLTTEDNTEARITIGQDVPFITGRQSGLQQGAVQSSVFSQIQREEVGIKLDVTPQISAGDTVSLELTVEVSKTVDSSVGLDPNLVGPTVQLAIIENQMVVRDKSTAIMGGLISEDVARSRAQTPFLGDLPLIGWLFRAKSDTRMKRNLVVLVTPHILPEGIDTERVTKSEIQAWSENNKDMIFEGGFIKKVRQKQNWRKNRYPSEIGTRKVLGEE